MKRQEILRHGLEVTGAAGLGWTVTLSGSAKWASIAFAAALVGALVWQWRTEAGFPSSLVRAQLASLMQVLQFDGKSDVRCTLHIPHGNQYRQALDYLPNGPGTAGRSFPANKGIVGRAIQRKERFTDNFYSDAEYRERMIKDYNYRADEVGRRSADRRSYYCIPLIDRDRVIAVIFFDAREPDVFPLHNSTPQDGIVLRTAASLRDAII